MHRSEQLGLSKILDVQMTEEWYNGIVSDIQPAIDLINEQFEFKPTLVNCRFIKPFDKDCLDTLIKSHDLIITMEEGALKGGFGSSVLHYCRYNKVIIESMGVPDFFC